MVVTHDSAAVLPGCLEALPAAFAGVPFEVVVVDNASTDGTVELARLLAPSATVLARPGNDGYAAAVNAGVAAAPAADAVLVLNPDTRLRPGAVAPLLAALAEPGVGIAVPRIVDGEGHLQHSLRREPTVRRALGEALLGGGRAGRVPALGETVVDPAAYERPGRADWATGAVMLVSRRCLDVVGPWDESFFLYSEETDFALRARDLGLGLRYVPEATAVHLGGESKTSAALWARLTRNRVRLYRRRHGPLPALAFRAAVVLNEALRARRGPTHRAALRALLTGRLPALPGAPDDADGGVGVLCFSAQDWWYFNRAHSDFQLMLRVAERRPVLLVNSIGMRMPLPGRSTMPWRRVLRKAASVARLARRPVPGLPGFHVVTPLFLPAYGSRLGRALNARLVRAQVVAAARWAGLRRPACVVTIPTALDVVRGMDLACVVYNRSDKHSEFGEADQGVIRALEVELLRSADAVVYASHALMEEEAGLSGDRAVFLDHGVDVDRFRPGTGPEPDDLAAVPRPRMGFFGEIEDYTVDVGLLERLAREVPEAQLVLVGNATCPMDGLTARPNVHWLGFRPHADIPRYGAGFDVALMPWQQNQWIRYCNPIKLKEYLALGLPVVSTDFPEVRRYGGVVLVAADGEEFVAHVRRVLAGGGPSDPAGRRAAVAGGTWADQAAQLLAVADSAAARAVRTLGAGRSAARGYHSPRP